MSAPKWTAGPWGVVDTHYPSIKSVSGPSFKITAVMWATDLQESDYQARAADLQLIASAPELYGALDDLVDLVEMLDGPYGLGPARAALAKARGEL